MTRHGPRRCLVGAAHENVVGRPHEVAREPAAPAWLEADQENPARADFGGGLPVVGHEGIGARPGARRDGRFSELRFPEQ